MDNVRGQTLPYAPEEMEVSRLTTYVIAVDDSFVQIRIEGDFHARAHGPWLLGDTIWKPKKEYPHSMKTRLWGQARFNRKTQTFDSFDLIALGEWSGKTQFNARGAEDSGLVGFVFTLPLSSRSTRVPPAFVDMYNADWIADP